MTLSEMISNEDAQRRQEIIDKRRKVIDEFLTCLTQKQQDIVERIFWQGQTVTEVARDLGVSLPTISKQLAAIRKRAKQFHID